MKDMTEVAFDRNCVVLEDNLVKAAILPEVASELERDVVIKSNSRIEGALYARRLEIHQGPFEVAGAVFAQLEVHINADALGKVVFRKTVGSADGIVSHSPKCQVQFLADVNAKQIHLRNAYVAASIFADEITLQDCVVVGGVFGSRGIELNNCVVGTFNAPRVRAAAKILSCSQLFLGRTGKCD